MWQRRRDGASVDVEVTHLVPGDIVHLGVGSIVPADVRLLTASNLECDESILTGESVPAEKSPGPVASGAPLAELSSCLFMGTVVHEGAADAVVVATGRLDPVRADRRRTGSNATPRPSSSSASPASRGCWPRSAAC